MNPVTELVTGIDPGRPLLGQMERRLRADIDWPRHVVALLESLPDDGLVALNREGMPPDVDPRVLAVADRDGVGVVRLNLFSREAFVRYRAAGTLSPHYHRRSFTTRLLTGSYHHLRYDNAGTLDRPDLTLRGRDVLRAGDGYALDWREYHFVVYPADGTVTLTVHTPPAIPPRGEFAARTRDEVLRLRSDIVAALARTPVPAS